MTSIQAVLPLGAGVLSFLSPCVWPLVPGYLSFLAGSALGQTTPSHWRTSQQALWFVAGSALVLIALGAGAAMLGASLKDHQVLVEQVGGVLLILFGLAFAGWVQIPWLSNNHRVSMLLFALGQGVPFLAMALLADRMRPMLRRFRRATTLVSSVGAGILIMLGVLLVSGQFSEYE